MLLTKATCYAAQQEFKKGVECCQKALEAAPDSPRGRNVKGLMQRAEDELAKQKAQDKPKPEEPKPAEPKPSEPKPAEAKPTEPK